MTTNRNVGVSAVRLWILAVMVFAAVCGYLPEKVVAEQRTVNTFEYPGSEKGKWATLTKKIRTSTKGMKFIPRERFQSSKEVLNRLRKGEMHFVMLNAFELEKEIPELGILGVPFLFKDTQNARHGTGKVKKMLDVAAGRKDLEIVNYTWTSGTFVSGEECVSAPRQLRGKEITGGYAPHRTLFRSAGAEPRPFWLFRPSPAMSTALGFFTLDYISRTQLARYSQCVTKISPFVPRLIPYVVIAVKGRKPTSEIAKGFFDSFVRLTEDTDAKTMEELERAYRDNGRKLVEITDDSWRRWQRLAEGNRRAFSRRVRDGERMLKTITR